MRILHLRFKNLNSLVGEWSLDLAHPAFAADGLFAITGPTGAGKSTILDAICLALYGRTPRLHKITKSSNEIMSRRTGDCFAEVTFETQAGRFRCHWSQRRARKKADGELQAQKHEIAHADTGEVFETKLKEVAAQIESVTGMDFDRFTRSMLLAQGGFDTFLHAEADLRAPILEQITGTEIYSHISTRVHQRLREEQESLARLQAEVVGFTLLEPEEEASLRASLASTQHEEAVCARAVTETEAAMAWLASVAQLENELHSLTDAMHNHRGALDAFAPDREILRMALSAAALEGEYATLTATRAQQADDEAGLKVIEASVPELAAAADEQVKALACAEARTLRIKQAQREAAPILQEVRALDHKLDEERKRILDMEERCTTDAAEVEGFRSAKGKAQAAWIEANQGLQHAKTYLREHAQDAWLISGLAGVEEQINGLHACDKAIDEKKGDLDRAECALKAACASREEAQRRAGIKKHALDDAVEALRRRKETVTEILGGRLLRELHAEKESLLREMAYLATIAELEVHRAKLEDGKSCPLCGAHKHPFAEGNTPVPDASEERIAALNRQIAAAEDQEAAIKACEETERSARRDLTEAEKREAAAAHDQKTAETSVAERRERLETQRADLVGRRQALSVKLLPLGLGDLQEIDPASLLATLRARLETYQAHVQQTMDIERQLADINSEVTRLDAVIGTQGAALEEKRASLEKLRQALALGSEQRHALFGDKQPDQEERHGNEALAQAEASEKQARLLHEARQQTLNTAQAEVATLRKRIERRLPTLRDLEAAFDQALTASEFPNEACFLEARRSPAERSALVAKAKALDERHTDLSVREKDRSARLAAERAKTITDRSLDELKAQRAMHEASLKTLRDALGGLTHKLGAHLDAVEKRKAKEDAIAAQRNEARKWGNLHAMIGSADGKKYRNFAQGLTFDIMVGHANRQLQKMSDRYLLLRDDTQPLELNVLDNHQAGEIRSTKNLSGGESFIVSLSLALGLSQMASKNVRVDSLFLDEGFGTLDEDALNTALETLAGLQQDGKLIGVISHVPALKERISTQIKITPQSGGRSLLSGPGCTKVEAAA